MLAVLGRVPKSADFSDVRKHHENRTIPGLLLVRPENGLFFANAAGIKEAIIREVNASTVPVKAVIIDMGTASDLDAPSADMLVALHKELRQGDVRFILTRMSTPVREILERADATVEIGQDDIHHSPLDALRDCFVSVAGDSAGQELVHIGLLEVRDMLRIRMSAVPAGRQADLAAVLDIIDKEIEQTEAEEPAS
jgi:MFS superfamily sulfate permease-like transporter